MAAPSHKPKPPEGFNSWLEYTILTFDGHNAALSFMFDAEPVDHHQIEAAVLDEFNALRALASLPPLASRSGD
ncbi:hypothetical protein [Neorhizobium sp. SHOUNA12B]|uniref:hypothetical protein n=1 Tax=Neorhizobium sp. SHOUNA12B TaxID=2908928 RepID=UPI0025D0DE1F|nr:hypothetical protein [Neorhizobium sp. SHOUNA12B]MCJ9671446.1 hypothetical protein [Neorhizobium sp. SHOUNA12B]